MSKDDDHAGLLGLINSLRGVHGTLELVNTEEWFYNESLLKAVYPLAPPEVKRVMCVDGQMDYAALLNALERHLNSLSRARTLLGHSVQPSAPPAEKKEDKTPKVGRRKGTTLMIGPAAVQGERRTK